jgi:hypothetical protein
MLFYTINLLLSTRGRSFTLSETPSPVDDDDVHDAADDDVHDDDDD